MKPEPDPTEALLANNIREGQMEMSGQADRLEMPAKCGMW